ncbi:5-(carboxyamino)imidazole ribonucleotide synthase [Methylobacillus rhizosphaerae]|uniref:N5-carboxyaminoimidazole ribonucleotide synthase n=1 Tax=Methylobacillus rhizosphaerae TaxID=551994 RepID=A0A238Y1R9_9PROT|nr:5-(carboxyamino)imidazole ribonucleotide synthase [Methylobacillus rhizosphaerae]SNR64721.1 5-(carboxyamino)imidazole ribonucleotide synthase [Methylobacillus rhizosphaerae]
MSRANTILPPAMLGMLGGGQLGRFFVIAAHEMGYKVAVLDPDRNSPAGKIADVHLCAAYDDEAALRSMAEQCAAITTEFENVPAATLEFLAQHRTVRPAASAVAIAQNRVAEKNFFRDAGLPVAPYAVIQQAADIPGADSGLYPAILKVARFGYDGKGQARVANVEEARAAFEKFGAEICVLERMLKLDYEVSLVLARDADGQVAAFPVAENAHLNGILDVSIAPARGDETIREQARALAVEVAKKLNYVGVLGVEFFVSEGQLLVNEMAPRPHNSGHYTIDACVTNQFEQQVRALAGLPLGDARQHSPAVMVNLLGDIWKNGAEPAWDIAFAEPGLKMHLYGKHEARPGRKMGHFTVIGERAEAVLSEAMQVRDQLGVGK